MKLVKKIDEDLALDLNTTVSDIPMILKHVHKLSKIVDGFVFAYHHEGLTYYDTVDVLRSCNGQRIRIPKFSVAPLTLSRIRSHHYQRWYVRCGDTLYPLQMAKPAMLEESFYFVVSDDPRYRTQTAYIGETAFIRKKALVACRTVKPGWGVHVKQRLCEAI